MSAKDKNIILVVLGIVLVLLGAYFFFFKGEKKDRQDNTNENENETQRQERLDREESERLLAELSSKTKAVLKNDIATVKCGKSVLIDVALNDKYKGEFALEISAPPTRGTAEITEDNKILYTVERSKGKGVDAFKYKITDENGTSDDASVVLKIECPYCDDGRNESDKRFSDTDFRQLDEAVRWLRRDGWLDEDISYAAAFLKGIDVMIDYTYFNKYKNRIINFKTACKSRSTKDIVRKPVFENEIREQVYQVGELLC